MTIEELSAYEQQAIEAIAASDPQRDVILAQLATGKCASRDYTGVGLYTNLAVDPSAALLDEARWKIEDMPKVHASTRICRTVPGSSCGSRTATLVAWSRTHMRVAGRRTNHCSGWSANNSSKPTPPCGAA